MLECEAVCEGVCSLTPGERGDHTAGSRGRGAPALTPPDRFRGGCPVSRSCRGGGRQPRLALAVLPAPGPARPSRPVAGKDAAVTLRGLNLHFPDQSAALGRSLKTVILS